MTIRSASLLAAVALAGLAAPALAQDYDRGPPPEAEHGWAEEEWDEEVHADEGGHGDAHRRIEVYRIHRSDSPDGHGLPPLGPAYQGARPHPMGYPPEQRAQWLEQCRATYYRDDRGEQRGEVIGGVLGAVAGGVAGNRIAGRGDRLGGTLIGAGVGGLAGSVVGGAVGRDADRDRAVDECEDYLLQYEQSYRGPGPGYGQGGYAHGGYGHGAVGYAYPYPYPVMWVKVPIQTRHGHGSDCGCETVVEEWVEERPAPPPPRRVRPAPDKRIRIVK